MAPTVHLWSPNLNCSSSKLVKELVLRVGIKTFSVNIIWVISFFNFSDFVELEEYQHDGAGASRSLPAICNFLEAWATVPGFASYRSVSQGKQKFRFFFLVTNYTWQNIIFQVPSSCEDCVAFSGNTAIFSIWLICWRWLTRKWALGTHLTTRSRLASFRPLWPERSNSGERKIKW